ncbi:MAG TPA: hypothetical protein VKI99_09105 [Candidatus Dormibacteraeota bacterium]|nr:hypothetical protein [Candidatus Dormibacteraeota bacterium]
MNGTKVLVLAFFAAYWVMVVAMLLAARPLYDQILSLSGNQAQAEIPALVVLTLLFGTLSIGVIRGWRWTFWVILVVFMAGLLRAVYSALQLTGIVPRQGPVWYVVLPGPVGLVQFCIAVVMLAGYRKVGGWGRGSSRP